VHLASKIIARCGTLHVMVYNEMQKIHQKYKKIPEKYKNTMKIPKILQK
jgi:hypothetical protein